MLAVRREQMDSLQAAAVRAFEDRTYAHLETYFPRHCELLGESQMRLVVRLGRSQAQNYGLTAECCVRSYIEFMCRLGSGFDRDPLLPWAARILDDRDTSGQIERGDRLYDQACDYIDHVALDYRDESGLPSGTHLMDGIRRLRRGNDSILTQPNYPGFARDLAAQLATLFPAKCAYVGERRVQALIPRAVRVAKLYDIGSERGIALVAALLFVLGNGFAADPLLPWVAAILKDPGIASERERTDRLYAEGIGFLKRWWDLAPGIGE
jgi:hypothetical protein